MIKQGLLTVTLSLLSQGANALDLVAPKEKDSQADNPYCKTEAGFAFKELDAPLQNITMITGGSGNLYLSTQYHTGTLTLAQSTDFGQNWSMLVDAAGRPINVLDTTYNTLTYYDETYFGLSGHTYGLFIVQETGANTYHRTYCQSPTNTPFDSYYIDDFQESRKVYAANFHDGLSVMEKENEQFLWSSYEMPISDPDVRYHTMYSAKGVTFAGTYTHGLVVGYLNSEEDNYVWHVYNAANGLVHDEVQDIEGEGNRVYVIVTDPDIASNSFLLVHDVYKGEYLWVNHDTPSEFGDAINLEIVSGKLYLHMMDAEGTNTILRGIYNPETASYDWIPLYQSHVEILSMYGYNGTLYYGDAEGLHKLQREKS